MTAHKNGGVSPRIPGCAERGRPAWGRKAAPMALGVPEVALVTPAALARLLQNSKPAFYRKSIAVP